MNDITPIQRAGAANSRDKIRKKSSADHAAWADALRRADAASGTEDVHPASALGLIPPIMDYEAGGDSRQQEQARGHAMLDRLDRLRHMLLLGAVSRDELHQIRDLIAQKAQADLDPRLQAIMNEIDTRARVELAKLDKIR